MKMINYSLTAASAQLATAVSSGLCSMTVSMRPHFLASAGSMKKSRSRVLTAAQTQHSNNSRTAGSNKKLMILPVAADSCVGSPVKPLLHNLFSDLCLKRDKLVTAVLHLLPEVLLLLLFCWRPQACSSAYELSLHPVHSV
jgi:hypothetical protein